MGCFNDPAWNVCGWWGVVGGCLTPTTYIQFAGAGSILLQQPHNNHNMVIILKGKQRGHSLVTIV